MALQEGEQFAAGAAFAAQFRSQGQKLSSWQRHVFAAQAATIASTLAGWAEFDGVLKVIFAEHSELLVNCVVDVEIILLFLSLV
jgi:hypothetical protein